MKTRGFITGFLQTLGFFAVAIVLLFGIFTLVSYMAGRVGG